jgi:hypothetical protein
VRPARTTTELTQVGWIPTGEVGLAEWSALGRRFGEIGRCSQWWLGDWINYGNARFGERYTRAVKLTGYDVQSLMNMVYVASRFEISRRQENLSWSHHATVASLDAASQDYWLARAGADKMSVADLRAELRGRRRALKPADGNDDGNSRDAYRRKCGGLPDVRRDGPGLTLSRVGLLPITRRVVCVKGQQASTGGSATW